MDSVKLDRPCQLQKAHLEAFRAIVGSENVTTEDYPRLAVAYGKTGYDAARLREKRIDSLPDVVLYPSAVSYTHLDVYKRQVYRLRGPWSDTYFVLIEKGEAHE